MKLQCKRCKNDCKKSGKQLNGKQKYRCKLCGLYQQNHYAYSACKHEIHNQFSRMNRLGCGSLKMARFLGISINTLQKWVGKALVLEPDYQLETGGVYDIDELQTYLVKRNNKIWIAYAWDVAGKRALAVKIGGRSANDLQKVIEKTLETEPRKINTDNHPTYGCLTKY